MSVRSMMFCIALSVGMGAYAALPPEHEAQRLLMATESAVTAGDWTKADQYLQQIDALDMQSLPEAEYYRGRVRFEAGDFSASRKAMEAYVSATGTEGRYYREALQGITRADEMSAARPAPVTPAPELPLVETAGADTVQKLKERYLAKTPRQALTAHLNQLLTTHAYHAQRVRKAEQSSGVRYELSVSAQNHLQIKEHDFSGADGSRATIIDFDVFGVNPVQRFDCSIPEQVCWIADPRDGYSRWLLLDRNAEAAEEIANTLSLLMVDLQGRR